MANTNPAPPNEDFLKEEYFFLQRTIENYDQKSLTFKGWTVTIGLAGIGAAFSQKAPDLLWISALASFLFMVIEFYWKAFQHSFYHRIIEIEMYFRGETADIYPLQTSKSWYTKFEKIKQGEWVRFLSFTHVLIPHAIVTLIGLSLYITNLFTCFIQ